MWNEAELGNLGPRTVEGPQSQSYFDTSNKLYETGRQPQYQAALKNLRQGWASRGFNQPSGMEKMAEMGTWQDYQGDIGQNRSKNALRASQIGEENRRREQDRGWQVADRDRRYEYLRQQEGRADAAARSAGIGQIGRGVGVIGGAVIGGMYGGPAGAGLGASLANSAFGGQATPYQPYPTAWDDQAQATPDSGSFDMGSNTYDWDGQY